MIVLRTGEIRYLNGANRLPRLLNKWFATVRILHCNLSPAKQLREAESVASFCLLRRFAKRRDLHCNLSLAEKLLEVEHVAYF